MFLVTNREVDESRSDLGAFKSVPNHLGPNELRLAEATRSGRNWRIKILPDQITPAMQKEVGLTPEKDPATGQPKPIYASRYVAGKLLARVNPAALKLPGKGRNLVFFVHGYNNDVKSVLDRAERLDKEFGVEVVAFTWPANGGGIHGVASYKSDKRSALASTGALDRCLGRIAEYLQEIHDQHVARVSNEADRRFSDDAEKWDRFFTEQSQKWCSFSVSMLLHSMGNYVYKHLLNSSIYRGQLLIFDNIVMVAADTNNFDHASWVNRMQCRNRIFITINERDSALRASRMKMGESQRARLGHYPYDLSAQHAHYMDFTDAAQVGSSHAYFEGKALNNKRVRRFFHEALNGRDAERGVAYEVASNMYRIG